MSILQQCHVVDATRPQTHTIILLHGRGSFAQEFAEDLFECDLPDPTDSSVGITLTEKFPSCRWIFPNAPVRYSTVFQEEIPEWFDIYSITNPEERFDLQKDGLLESLQMLVALMRDDTAKIETSRLIIGGISQGFATAAVFMLVSDIKCAGFIGLSGWLPFASGIAKAINDSRETMKPAQCATRTFRQHLGLPDSGMLLPISQTDWTQTPIFVGHEQHDRFVAAELGKTACHLFQACQANASWHAYDSGSHWIQEPDEIEDIARFLDVCLKD